MGPERASQQIHDESRIGIGGDFTASHRTVEDRPFTLQPVSAAIGAGGIATEVIPDVVLDAAASASR